MESHEVMLSASRKRRCVLPRCGPAAILRAMSPPPAPLRHGHVASRFLESSALRLETKSRDVLSVGGREADFCLCLTDELGIRAVDLLPHRGQRGGRLRRRGKRMRGVGHFGERRQLGLLPPGGER
jgi:hypothetical protein